MEISTRIQMVITLSLSEVVNMNLLKPPLLMAQLIQILIITGFLFSQIHTNAHRTFSPDIATIGGFHFLSYE